MPYLTLMAPSHAMKLSNKIKSLTQNIYLSFEMQSCHPASLCDIVEDDAAYFLHDNDYSYVGSSFLCCHPPPNHQHVGQTQGRPASNRSSACTVPIPAPMSPYKIGTSVKIIPGHEQ